MGQTTNQRFQAALNKERGFTGRKLMFDGSLTLLAGAFIIWQGPEATRQMIDWLAFYLVAFGSYHLATHFLKHVDNRSDSFVGSIIRVVLGLALGLVNRRTDIAVSIPIMMVAIYQLFVGLIQAITYGLYRKDGIVPRGRYLFDAILYTALGLGGLLDVTINLRLDFLFLGGYLVFYGIANIRDGLFFESDASRTNLKRQGRLSLPIALIALMPRASLDFLNRHLYDLDYEPASEAIYRESKDQEGEPDLEIFVHTAEQGFEAMGHVDICYKGQVIAYGNYDVLSGRLMGSIGDGVLFTLSRADYIEFCKVQGKMTLFGYGLSLSEEQRQAIEAELQTLRTYLVPWEPDGQLIDGQPMYAYRLQQATDARFFKFTATNFKTYFVLSTNCVLLADRIVGQAGTAILSPRGIITPGTYQQYLEREYAKPHSLVVTRSIYKDITPPVVADEVA